MGFVLDTSVAIPLRDDDRVIQARVHALGGPHYFSMLTLVELESGVYRDSEHAYIRRQRLDVLLSGIGALDFTSADARVYGAIVAASGFSRRKVVDRVIAAQAIARQCTLVTLNPADFADVQHLKVLAL